jgi:predicted ATP-dependent serine protease
MVANRESACYECGRIIEPGTSIKYDSRRGAKHESCLFAATPGDEFLDSQRFIDIAGRNIEWTVDGRVPEGGVTLLVAREKCGKSSLGLAMARSVARGEEFLGASTKRGRVLYAAFEGSRQGWAERIDALGFKPSDEFLFRLGNPPEDYARWTTRTLSELKPGLLVIDVLARCTKADDLSTYGIATQVMQPFIAAARNHNCSIMLLHHARKGIQGESEQEMGLDDVSGSTALAASADTVMLMKRDKDGTRYLRTFQRDGEDMEPSPLHFNVVTREFTGTCMRPVTPKNISADHNVVSMDDFLKGIA